MQSLSLAILYTPTGGRPVRVATVSNEHLLLEAAKAAIREAQGRAELLASTDTELSRVESEEATRLVNLFSSLVPVLEVPSKPM